MFFKNDTVTNYLKIMQKCFHIVLIKPFHRNLRKELVKMSKVFLLDTGIRNCLLHYLMPLANRTDKGDLWKNCITQTMLEIEPVLFPLRNFDNRHSFHLHLISNSIYQDNKLWAENHLQSF